MATYFWSDTHFNHSGILGYTSRPYKDVYEMNEALIALWNSKVTKASDHTWIIGDFGFHYAGAPDLYALFWRLNGKKSLVVGNHDEKNPATMRLPWERVEKLVTVKENHRSAELCHYPLETWKGSHHRALMLHGHCHGTLRRKLARRFDVGVDTKIGKNGPIPFEELIALGDKEVFVPTDAHGDGVKGDM